MFVTVCFGPLIIQREVNYRGQWTTPPDTADLLQEKYVHIESVWRLTPSVRYWLWWLGHRLFMSKLSVLYWNATKNTEGITE